MNVFSFEIKSNMKSALIWGISLGMVGFLFIAIFPSFLKEVESLDILLAAYPPEVLKALGLGEDGLNSFQGFYSFCIIYTILCGAIQALIMGIQVISKEGARKTSDFLFTKPQNRLYILISKYSAVLVCIFITSGIYMISTFASSILFVKDMDGTILLLMNGAFLFTQIIFLSMGFCIGCFAKKIKSPTTVGIGIGSMFFAIEMISNMYDDKSLQLISPMSYINPSYIAKYHSYDITMFLVLVVVIVVFAVSGVLKYKTKDIHSA